MDQTTRPAKIPPEFLLYAEKHALFELFQVNREGLNTGTLRCENEYLNIFLSAMYFIITNRST
jgi:hypothetical protein